MKKCPHCARKLVLHIHNKRLYWFCSRCNEEISTQDDDQTLMAKAQVVKPLQEILSSGIFSPAESSLSHRFSYGSCLDGIETDTTEQSFRIS